jgi:hypothetical protein
MPAPVAFTVPAGYTVKKLTDDKILDQICRMGGSPTSTFPATIRAAFDAATRRGLLTRSEAEAGIAICLKIKR